MATHEGVGLRNARDRLRLLFGERASLDLDPTQPSVATAFAHSGQSLWALIIDVERPARREMRRLLADFTWFEVVGEAGNVDQAEGMIGSLTPELLFLDIQMPGGSGFDLLSRLEDLPQVIFTTAYDEHAVRAFEVDALDYLLKPIDPRRLAEALSRAKSAQAARTPTPGAVLEQIFVRDGSRCWFVPLREVRLLSSEGNYIRLS